MKKLLLATAAVMGLLALSGLAGAKEICIGQVKMTGDSLIANYIQRGSGDDLCQFNPNSAAGKKILKTCMLGDVCKAVVSFQQCSKDAEICGPGGDIETVYSVKRVIKGAAGRAKGHL
jgi:hypothetical protein